jgi:uncharacterized membrane protein
VSHPRIIELEKTVDRLLTVLISKGIITPDQADTISTGIPKHKLRPLASEHHDDDCEIELHGWAACDCRERFGAGCW